MGTSNNWLEKRKNRQRLIARIQNIAIGSLIAAITIGPLIYFAAVAVPLEVREARNAQRIKDAEATPDVATVLDLAATPEIVVSQKPIKFDEKVKEKTKKEKEKDAKLEAKKGNLKVELELEELPGDLKTLTLSQTAESIEPSETLVEKLDEEFKLREDLEIKTLTKVDEEKKEEKLIIAENLEIQDGPRKVQKKDDAETVAIAALRKYLNSSYDSNEIAILKDTSKVKSSSKKTQLVLSQTKTNNGKWYVTFQQYEEGLPVFDGNIKMIFTERKSLLALSDNIRDISPEVSEFTVNTSFAEDQMKEVFDWDETLDEVEFVDQGYYKNKPAYRIEASTHNPLGDWQVLVDGETGEVHKLESTISLQYSPQNNPETGDLIEPEDIFDILPVNEEGLDYQGPVPEPIQPENREVPTNIPLEVQEFFASFAPQESEDEQSSTESITEPTITIDYTATPEPIFLEPGTAEPDILILDTIFSQVLGKIFPKTPNDQPQIVPFENEYAYYNSAEYITDAGGYFENEDLNWYSVFLEGPYVRVSDDLATSDAEITDTTPENPFVWDENYASLEAINAFYHTNKIRKYFADEVGMEINSQVDLTVNSELVEQYMDGCGAWFDNNQKTIEMGTGGGITCPEELNYSLGSDFIYHEYAHYAIEEVTHLPNITGAESAAIAEGLADYFAATINNDALWGDVIAPNRTRNLDNTMNYNTDMIGQSHHDGQVFSGALWDLRQAIGQEATDQLVFNTLYQDRMHFETFMYGMIIEDDDDNDFSNGTPNLIAIIQAFEKHGIGPGVQNFDGLPISPEAWSELLEEEPVDGIDSPLYGNYTGNCSVSGDGNTLYVSGGTCYMWSTNNSYTDVYVYSSGVLQMGYVSSPSTATTLTVSGTLYVYATGRINVGHASISNYAYLNATGSIVMYSSSSSGGGVIQVVNNTSYANYITGYPTVTINGHDADVDINDANIYLQDASWSYFGQTTVYGNLYVGYRFSSPPFINIDDPSTLFSDDEIRVYNDGFLDVAATTNQSVLYTQNLDIGDASNNGGTVENDGYIRVYDYVSIGDTGLLDNNDSAWLNYNVTSSAIRSTSLYDSGSLENDGEIRNEGRINMYDTSTLTNNSNFTLNETLLMNGTSDITNTSSFLLDYYSQPEGDLFIEMRDDSTIDNSGTLQIRHYLQLGVDSGDNPSVTNTGTVYVGWNGSASWGSLTTNRIYIYNDGEFINSGLVAIDKFGSVSTDGNLYVYPNSNSINDTPYYLNAGTTNLVSVTVTGGTNSRAELQNNFGKTMNIEYNGTSFPAVDINGDALFDQFGTANIDWNVTIDGTDADSTAEYNNGNGTSTILGNVILNTDYSSFTNSSTTNISGYLVQSDESSFINEDGATLTVADGITLNDSATLDNGSTTGSTASIDITGESLHARDASYVTNWGSMIVYDDIIMDGDTGSESSILNYGPISVTESSSNELQMTDDNLFWNMGQYAKVDIDYSSNTESDGLIKIYYDSKFINFNPGDPATYGPAMLFGRKMFLGREGTGTAGGDFYNLANSIVQMSSNGSTTLDIYKGANYYNGYDVYGMNYDGQFANFKLGNVITGGTTGAKGLIISDSEAGSNSYGTLYLAMIYGSFQNNEVIRDGYTSHSYTDFGYNSQTANFTVGATLTGPSGTGTIITDNDSGSSGSLRILVTSGSFSSGQAISDSGGGAATISTTPQTGGQGTAYVNGTMGSEEVFAWDGSNTETYYDLLYQSQTSNFTIGSTLTGPSGTATIIEDDDNGATGTLKIDITSGSFSSGQAITDGGGGSATTGSAATEGYQTTISGYINLEGTLRDSTIDYATYNNRSTSYSLYTYLRDYGVGQFDRGEHTTNNTCYSYSSTYYDLNYDGQTSNFTVGATVTLSQGVSTYATGTIIKDQDNGSYGTLTIKPLTGSFTYDDKDLTDSVSGAATSNGSQFNPDDHTSTISVGVHDTDYTPTDDSTLNCATLNIGQSGSDAGGLALTDSGSYGGIVNVDELYVYEDDVSGPDNEAEVVIQANSELNATTVIAVLGQLYNFGTVNSDDLNVRNGGNYVNGGTSNHTAQTTITSDTQVYVIGTTPTTYFDNYALFDTDTLSVTYNAVYNNQASSDLDVSDWLEVYGGTLTQYDTSYIDVTNESYFYEDTSNSTGDVNIDSYYTTGKMWIGDGGTLSYSGADVDVSEYGNLHVTSTANDAAYIYKQAAGHTNFGELRNNNVVLIDGRINISGSDASHAGLLENGSLGFTDALFGTDSMYINGFGAVTNRALMGDVGGGYPVYAINLISGLTSSNIRAFWNYDPGQLDANTIIVPNNLTFTNYNTVNVDSLTRVDYDGQVDNYDLWDTDRLQIGIFSSLLQGGVFNNQADGDLNVLDDTTGAAEIYKGELNVLNGSAGFDVAGRLSIYGDPTTQFAAGGVSANDGSSNGRPTTTLGELYMYANSYYYSEDSIEIDDSGTLDGDLYMEGTSWLIPATLQIDYTDIALDTTTLTIDGTTTISDYGEIQGYAPNDPGAIGNIWVGGVQAMGAVSVAANGRISSDTDSCFYFHDGITTSGEVTLEDQVRATTYTQTGGTSIFGDETHVGLSYIEGLLDVSGGDFTTYNYGDNLPDGFGSTVVDGYSDVEVDGASTTFTFANDDGSSARDCHTDIHGYLDILNDATVRIDCETDPAVNVHSGSPGGTTLVQGTLIINTNLYTEDIIIGDGTAGGAGLVTHDAIPNVLNPTWDPAPETVFNLYASDSFTLKANSLIDVSSKYKYDYNSSTGSLNRGGTNGGRGQYDGTSGSPITEYSSPQVLYADGLSSLAFDGQLSNEFTIGATLTGVDSGATGIIVDQVDNGSSGTLTLIDVLGTFEDNESLSDSEGGAARVNGTLTAGRLSIEDFGSCGMTDGGNRCSGAGGGIMHIFVGDEHADSDNMTIEAGSVILANGQSASDGGGSGGTINIVASNRIIGSGGIAASGGSSSATTGHDTAGGGGRIFIAYYDEDTFSTDFTGIVGAIGGSGAINSVHGGTGTITRMWTNPWGNQKDGTILVDAFDGTSGGTYPVDVAGNGVGTISASERTNIATTTAPGVESVQIENGAQVSFTTVSRLQQCLIDSDSDVSFPGGSVAYNREHGNDPYSACMASPDPVGTLHINNSSVGTSSGLEGEQDDTIPHIQDLTPYMSGIHYDGRFDSDGSLADATADDTLEFQVQIAESENALFAKDLTIVTGCDWEDSISQSDSGSRVEIEMDATCAANLTGAASPGQRYYYRIRFQEDTTGAYDLWGLWSEMNNFYIDEAGYITFKKCNNKVADLDYDAQTSNFTVGETLTGPSGTATILNDIDNGADGTLTIQIITGGFADNDAITDSGGGSATAASEEQHKFYLGTYDSSKGDNVFSDYCNFETEATVPIYIKASKNQELNHTVNTLVYLWDMATLDFDPPDSSGGLDGIRYFEIDYGSQTGVFTVGATLSSATGSGRIISDTTPGIGDGTLTVRLQTGYFSNGDSLTDGITGAATATSNPLDDYDNEVGFHTDNLTGSLISQISNAGTFYHTNYTFLPNTPTTIIDSNSGYSNQSFDMWLSAFIHGLIPHPTDPINVDPTGTCGYFNLLIGQETHDTCTSLSGTYTATVTVTASATP